MTSTNNSVNTPVGAIVTDQNLLGQRLDEFKNFRSLFQSSFLACGLQPSTAKQVGSDEDNLNTKRQNYKWLLRPDFVPQVNDKAFPTEGDLKLKAKEDILDQGRTASFMTQEAFALAPKSVVSSMAEIETLNRTQHEDKSNKTGDFYDAPNIGLREDWFTDAVYAQQQFTGVNPTTITILSDDSIYSHFVATAKAQNNTALAQLIATLYPAKQLYVQDCSYYRTAAGLTSDDDIKFEFLDSLTGLKTGRYGCASMVLFSLDNAGKLHPLAITLDYTKIETSRITIFNKRLTPADTTHDEKEDWPWRYAKMCAQVSDWSRHEMTVHLTDTHLIEETIIVAAQRNFPDSHIILKILNSNWQTTLSLNALAYGMLVPGLIAPVAPFTHAQVVKFIGHARAEFDFKGRYVPTDLEKRGFPVCELENPTGKFHNYTYARQVYKMWGVTRKFVASILSKSYANDAAVAADAYLSGFITEIRAGDGKTIEGGFLPKFPVVNTLEGLIDMVTMCIHIAAPQHTAVNYLQQFYLAFIPNRPASLYTPLPESLAALQRITETEVLAALPLKKQRDWLMMAGVPYLLSEEVETADNIVSYANGAANHRDPLIAKAGKVFRQDINDLVNAFKESSSQNDDKQTEYKVLYPDLMASAIII